MTYEEIYEKAKQRTEDEYKSQVLEDGIVVMFGPGNTWAVSKLNKCHAVHLTAFYYAALRATGGIDAAKGKELLENIAKYQVMGTGTRQDGNFLRYTEETVIQDYNAANFMCEAFLKLLLFFESELSAEEKELIYSMFEKSLVWFGSYCKNAELYYANAVLSNLSCYYCISNLLNKNKAEALEAVEKFFGYTEKRGWGWGENLSPGYLMAIIIPLRLISTYAKKYGEQSISDRAEALIGGLLKFHAFHGDLEPAPAIRNYNTRGDWTRPRQTKLITGVTDDPNEGKLEFLDLLLYEDEIRHNSENRKACEKLWAQKTLVTHIFDNAYATTYRGENVHLGTINEFPFMQSTMQNPSWGTGWQSLPVVFTVRGEQMAYLRYEVTANGRRRCLPHETRYQPNDINASLFNERLYPDMYTISAQRENLALAVRRVVGLHNSISELVDEFAVANFKGDAKVYNVGGIDFAVLRYENTPVTVILAALHGITLHKEGKAFPQPETTSVLGPDRETVKLEGLERDGARCPQRLEIGERLTKLTMWEDTTRPFLTVSQTMYKGEDRRLDVRVLETSWAVITLDRRLDDAEEYLKSIKISLESVHDYEKPRWQDTMIYKATLEAEGKKVELCYDPYTRKAMM